MADGTSLNISEGEVRIARNRTFTAAFNVGHDARREGKEALDDHDTHESSPHTAR